VPDAHRADEAILSSNFHDSSKFQASESTFEGLEEEEEARSLVFGLWFNGKEEESGSAIPSTSSSF
jgi:hypothetical protein